MIIINLDLVNKLAVFLPAFKNDYF